MITKASESSHKDFHIMLGVIENLSFTAVWFYYGEIK